jgi:hypothetical protein
MDGRTIIKMHCICCGSYAETEIQIGLHDFTSGPSTFEAVDPFQPPLTEN